MSLKEKMSALADAVREKAELTANLTIDRMTEAVNSLVVNGVEVDERTLSVTPSKSQQTFTSSDLGENAYYGTVTVFPIPSEYITTDDATALFSDILSGKTAYVNGTKVTGGMTDYGDVVKKFDNISNTLHIPAHGYFESIEVTLTKKELTVTPSAKTQYFDVFTDEENDVFYSKVTVDPIPSEYITTDDATAKKFDIIEGKTAYVNGEKVTGVYKEVSEEDVCWGVEFGAYDLYGGTSGIDEILMHRYGSFTGDATAGAEHILEGKTAYAFGVKVTGTMPAKQAETYTPGTADITITSGVYLSEAQTIKGDANLTADNIRTGVSIFNVEGTFTSDADAAASDIAEGKTAYVKGEKVTGTGTRFYKCTSVDTVNKTWTGYKAVLTDGIYSFEENATEGLTYGSGFSPAAGEIYNSEATIQVTRLYTGADPTLLFFAPLTKETDRAETGQLLAAAGTITYDEGFANITNNGNITAGLNADASNYTIAFWVKKGSFDNYNGFFTIDDGERQLFVDKYINDMRVQVYYSVFESLLSSRFTNAQWTHYVLVFSADKVSLYVDGELAGENEYDQQFVITQSCQLIIGKGDYELGGGYMKDFRIYEGSKSRAEIEYIMELNRP